MEVFRAEVSVRRPERALRRHVVPPRIEPVGVDILLDRRQVDEVAQRLAHLLAFTNPETMGVDTAGKRQVKGHEDGGPDHRMEPEDLLADDVVVGGPVLASLGKGVAVGFAEPQGGDVVHQRVDPDVDHVLGIVGHRHAPREVRAADGDVLKPLAQSAEHFVAPRLGADEVRLLGKKLLEPLLEGTETEVVIALFGANQWLVVHGGLVLEFLGLGLGDVLLLAFVVPALELAQVHDAGVDKPLDEILHLPSMTRLGRSDEIVVGGTQQRENSLELRGVVVGKLLRGDALSAGDLLDPHPMLVGAGEEKDVTAGKSHEPRIHVANSGRVRVPDMRLVVDVVNGGGDVGHVAGHGRPL